MSDQHFKTLINAQELITKSQDENTDFELISCEKIKSPEQIRKAYHRTNLDPLDKAMEKGSDYVRNYFNDKNWRKTTGKWNCKDTKFTPVQEAKN